MLTNLPRLSRFTAGLAIGLALEPVLGHVPAPQR